jgi:hypothetical protein
MKFRSASVALLFALFIFGIANSAQAISCVLGGTVDTNGVCAGFDLFQTGPSPATFNGIPFVGVPIGSFNFGSGPVSTGNTDTIVQRLDNVSSPSGNTGLEIRALQLRSSVQMSGHFLFATLDNLLEPIGLMTIDITGGTFITLDLPVNFRIHNDSFAGPDAGFCGPTTICSVDFTTNNVTWGRNPPPFALLIGGVDYQLNGTNTNNDFWPAPFQECFGPNNCHPVVSTTPEPSTLLLLGVGLLAAATTGRSRLFRSLLEPRPASSVQPRGGMLCANC